MGRSQPHKRQRPTLPRFLVNMVIVSYWHTNYGLHWRVLIFGMLLAECVPSLWVFVVKKPGNWIYKARLPEKCQKTCNYVRVNEDVSCQNSTFPVRYISSYIMWRLRIWHGGAFWYNIKGSGNSRLEPLEPCDVQWLVKFSKFLVNFYRSKALDL